MSLVKCPECGREKVSDSAEACPDCGYGIKAHFIRIREEEKQKLAEEEERKRKIEEEKQKQERAKLLEEQSIKRKELAQKRFKKILPVIIIMIVACIGICIFLKVIGKKEYRAAVHLYKNGNYREALLAFTELDGYRDSDGYIEKCEVNLAVAKYNDGDYSRAYRELILLTPEAYERTFGSPEISLDDMLYDCRKNCAELGHTAFTQGFYEKAANYFDVCCEYDSTSYAVEYRFTSNFLSMRGYWYLFKYDSVDSDKWVYITNDYVKTKGIALLGIEDGEYEFEPRGILYIPDVDAYFYPPRSDGGMTVKVGGQSYNFYDNMFYTKNKVEENKPKDPAIGMTAAEVEASSWGKPKKINKTTYTWGVLEQWVYSGNRYIYLEDGKVTIISE